MESNQLISPKHFERFALPSHAEYIAGLKILGITRYFFHICGDQKRNLPFLSEISSWPHSAVISIGHEVALREATGFFPNDIIYGNIDPRVIQSGTPQEVYNESRKTIETGKTIRGGFILAPGCDLPVSSPQENVFAMVRAVKDAGIY
jgi:uroporphyrinogen decarboxylase